MFEDIMTTITTMPTTMRANAVAEIGKHIKIENVATNAGRIIDVCTGGKTNAEEVGRKIDEMTKDITIRL